MEVLVTLVDELCAAAPTVIVINDLQWADEASLVVWHQLAASIGQLRLCHGARFNDATLAVRIDGLTIADVLGLSVDEALERFADRAALAAALRPVSEVGLGYLRLGEPTPSLSGGESQRLRIAFRLRASQRGALYVFDEPSIGLHPLDVATLADVFGRLLEAGATIIVMDHDLDLLAAADHLIDMGPAGGPAGGHILAAGTPEDVARDPGSVTGPWLAEHLGLPQARRAGVPCHSQS